MFVVYDLETTGLSDFQDDIIQFAYIMFDDNLMVVKSEVLYFYYEGIHWNQKVCDEVHHITLDFLKQHKDKFRENCIKMWTVLSGNIVVGHNNKGFDDPFAANWLARQGLPGLTFGGSFDTMADLKAFHKRNRIKLTVLGDMCGFTVNAVQYAEGIFFGKDLVVASAHNAIYDVTLTALITMFALRNGYFNFNAKQVPVSVAEAVDPYADIMSIDNMDRYKAVYCKLIQYDGSIVYKNTTSNTAEFPSIETTETPAYRVFPCSLSKVGNIWQYADGFRVITLHVEPTTVYLEISTMGTSVITNKMKTEMLAQ